MRIQEMDDFCAEYGNSNMKGVVDKWREQKTEFYITQEVQQKSLCFSRKVKKPASTANFSTMKEVSDGADANYSTAR